MLARSGLTRRQALKGLGGGLAGSFMGRFSGADPASYELSTFQADITPPLGHALMGGGISPAQRIEDRLSAHGFVLKGGGLPIVLVSLDWCEVRNDAYDRWRTVLAKVAGTSKERVLLTCIHQHDAPVADLTAQRLLTESKAAGSICDTEFHETAVQCVARALQDSLSKSLRVTHLGLGQRALIESPRIGVTLAQTGNCSSTEPVPREMRGSANNLREPSIPGSRLSASGLANVPWLR